jgi:hypothetical protein
VQPAGFFFAAKPDKGHTGTEGAGDPVEAIEPPIWGHPNEPPAPSGLHPNQGAAMTQGSPFVTVTHRADSAALEPTRKKSPAN